jgi:hypothetical protein
MSRKHFSAMAAMFKRQLEIAAAHPVQASRIPMVIALEYTIRGAAGIYAAENPAFDEARFFTACGLAATGDLPASAYGTETEKGTI